MFLVPWVPGRYNNVLGVEGEMNLKMLGFKGLRKMIGGC